MRQQARATEPEKTECRHTEKDLQQLKTGSIITAIMTAQRGKLTTRQIRFAELYSDHASKTFGNAVKSYIAAGYKNGSSVSQNASRLLANDKISKAVSSYRQKQDRIEVAKVEISAEYARQALVDTYEEAQRSKDLTNRVACVRLLLQTTGQLSDKLVIDVQGARQLEEHKHREAKRIASYISNSGLLLDESEPDTQPAGDNTDQADDQAESRPIIDAEFLTTE